MLDTTLSALSDPTRRSIVSMLADKELSVGEVVAQFELTQSAISRHLDVLERANLIVRRRAGQRRLCKLSVEPLQELSAWLETYRRFWDSSFDRLEETIGRNRS